LSKYNIYNKNNNNNKTIQFFIYLRANSTAQKPVIKQSRARKDRNKEKKQA
jgi:hypothetical protein